MTARTDAVDTGSSEIDNDSEENEPGPSARMLAFRFPLCFDVSQQLTQRGQ